MKQKNLCTLPKNGTNDLVVLSDEAYEDMLKKNKETEEERIDRLVAEHFDKHYASFEEFKRDVFKKIDEALKEVDEGKGIPMEEIVAEMEADYDTD